MSGGEGSREATPRTNQPSRYSFSAFSIVVQLLSEQAVRLKNGDTLISDQFNHQVIEVTQAGNILWSYGQIGVSGSAAGMLNAPYGAKVIGDYTGLTPPTGF